MRFGFFRGIDYVEAFQKHKLTNAALLAKSYFITKDERFLSGCRRLVNSWRRSNPPGYGVGYLSTVNIAQRVSALTIVHDLCSAGESGSSTSLVRGMVAQEVQFLSHHTSLHWEPRNNYVIAEAAAQILGGIVLAHDEQYRELISRNVDLLIAELSAQSWPDGVSKEQSNAYHRFVVECALAAMLSLETSGSKSRELFGATERMTLALLQMARPDGRAPDFGDSAGERFLLLDEDEDALELGTLAPLAVTIFRALQFKWIREGPDEAVALLLGGEGWARCRELRAARSGPASVAFPDGGYFLMRGGFDRDANYLAIDCGPLGFPGKRPRGHGHNDLLSIEVCVRGVPAIVDSGTFSYFRKRQMRNRFRGTSAHNTIVVDRGEISALSRDPFAFVTAVPHEVRSWKVTDEYDYFSGAHRGFAESGSNVEVSREVLFAKPSSFFLCDTIVGSARHETEVRFHIAPGWRVKDASHESVVLECGEGRLLIAALEESTPEVQLLVSEDELSPHYGKCITTPLVVFGRRGQLPHIFTTFLSPLDASGDLRVEAVVRAAQEAWSAWIGRDCGTGRMGR